MKLVKNSKLSMLLDAYSQAFVVTLPYLILMASSILATQIMLSINIAVGPLDGNVVGFVSQILAEFFPVVLLISITFQLAKRSSVNQIMTVIIALASYITIISVEQKGVAMSGVLNPDSASLLVLCIPLFVTYSVRGMGRWSRTITSITPYLKSSLNNIIPNVLTYSLAVFLFVTVDFYFFDFNHISLRGVFNFSDDVLLFLKTIGNHLLWFVGLHGDNLMNSVFGNDFQKNITTTGMSYKQMYDLFVIFGGAGAGMSLVIAIFLSATDRHSLRIARLATPFVIFNINEILVFGLPIIFNRQLLLPFLIVPLSNLLIIQSILFLFPDIFLIESVPPWITPVFINAYFATGGSSIAIALQLLLIILGTLIYIPFIRSYTTTQSLNNQIYSLANKLELTTTLDANSGLSVQRAYTAIIESNNELEGIIQLLNNNNLHVYYQPKIDVDACICSGFEALLRLELEDGKVVGPYFLESIEDSGLAPIIDLWVCQKVFDDLSRWNKDEFTPTISINLHPDTLSNKQTIEKIVLLLKGRQVDFEVIERSFVHNTIAEESIQLLKQSGFTLSIDDYGTGFSSLSTLVTVNFDYLKLDKSLIDLIEYSKGYDACDYTVRLCEKLGIEVVAEGVETKKQLKLVQKMGIKYVQGYYFSPAIKPEHVPGYMLHKDNDTAEAKRR